MRRACVNGASFIARIPDKHLQSIMLVLHLWHSKILEAIFFAFAYRLFHEDSSPIDWSKRITF